MDISVVRRRVCLKHGNSETDTSVLVDSLGVEWVGSIGGQTSQERSTKASNGDALVGSLNWDWVGESDAWWAGATSSGLVDVGGGGSWGRVVSPEADELDVVADQVEIRVETEVIVSNRARQTASEGVDQAGVVLDDLIWGGDDAELGGVLDGEVNLVLLWRLGDC